VSYADSQLTPGERVVRRGRQHWLIVVRRSAWAILALLLAALLLYVRAVVNGSSPMFEILGWITFVLAVFGALAVAWAVLAFHSEEYVLTTRRLIHADGIINKRANDISLDRITDAVLMEPFLGRLLGYGDLRILMAGAANERLRQLRQPTAFRQALFEARHELELERARPTMPPIRIASGAAVAPSVAPPPPPSAPAMTQAEVVAELSRLAAQRAAGEIDAETFDRGRRDLLSRL
jgi:Bacterial PH domain